MVEIRCCPICASYKRRAAELLQALEQRGVPARLVRGRWGEFTVLRDGQIVARRRWLQAPSVERVLQALITEPG
ncbi:MAG TPA: hypothetical protein VF198_18455 [Vicinamibacterales bacterium]